MNGQSETAASAPIVFLDYGEAFTKAGVMKTADQLKAFARARLAAGR